MPATRKSLSPAYSKRSGVYGAVLCAVWFCVNVQVAQCGLFDSLFCLKEGKDCTNGKDCCNGFSCMAKDAAYSECRQDCPSGWGCECQLGEENTCTQNREEGCCEVGTSCFQRNAPLAECHPSCPTSGDWDCHVCSKAIEEDCTESSTCCQEGSCFQKTHDYMQCLHACPTSGEEPAWDCEKCEIEEGDQCTPEAADCCTVGECFRRDEFFSVCLRHCPAGWDCQCTLEAGENCSAGTTSACCDPAQGLSCFRQDKVHAECLASCPLGQDPPWNCECAIADGGECTDPTDGCCQPGLECFNANASFAACLSSCPAEEGWACEECSLRLSAECTNEAGGCCQRGKCVQQSDNYAECQLECPAGQDWDCEKCNVQAGGSCLGAEHCCDASQGLSCFEANASTAECHHACPTDQDPPWTCECGLDEGADCTDKAAGCCTNGLGCHQASAGQSICRDGCPKGEGWKCEVCEMPVNGECTNPDSGCCADEATCFRKDEFYSQCKRECPLGEGWDCETCVVPEGDNCHEPSRGCCVSGTMCYQKDAKYSQCLRKCPGGAGWDCETCQIHEFGECTDNPDCCRYGTSCFKKDDDFSQCLQECPQQQGWDCDCSLLAWKDCTNPGAGCCSTGSICLQKNKSLAICVGALTDLVNDVVDELEDLDVVGIPVGSILGGLTKTVTEEVDEVVDSTLSVLTLACPSGWACPSYCKLSHGATCTMPEDGCCEGSLRCLPQTRWHAECLDSCPAGWACDVPPAPCPNGKLDQAGRCWQYFGDAQTWDAANRTCAEAGLRLASLHSPEERQMMFEIVMERNHSMQSNLWVGGRVGVTEAWEWEWSDGSPMQYVPWLGYRPRKSFGGCLSMVLTSRTLHGSDSIGCDTPLPLLCASAPLPCPSGTYGSGIAACTPCPANGTSVAGQNLGVLSCKCPKGSALTHNSEHARQQTRECVAVGDSELANCSGGIYDAYDKRCWVWVAETKPWEEAEAECVARGLHLASLTSEQEQQLLESVYLQNGKYSGHLAWLGATMQPERGPTLWHWSNAAAFTFMPWDLGVGEPSSRYGYAQFCGAARIRRWAGASSLSVADEFCNEHHASVCASEPKSCPPGMFGPKYPDCEPCPMDGTSIEGGNTDVLACRCPQGFAMSIGGAKQGQCIETGKTQCNGGVKDEVTGRCWKLLDNQTWSFDDAARACEAEGMILSSLSSSDSGVWEALLRAHARRGSELGAQAAWVGGRSNLKSDASAGPRVWEWMDGSTFNYFPWDTNRGEPHVSEAEACLAMRWDLADARGYGQNAACHETLPAICAEPPVSCVAGQYGPSLGHCSTCPHGGASKKGSNHGVLACECPPFEATVYGGDNAGQCILEEKCNGGVWDAGMGRCWRYIPPTSTWVGARHECERWGMTLASFQAFSHTQIASAIFVSRDIKSQGLLWVGARKSKREGVWEWADGSPAVSMPWMKGEPSSEHGEDCTAMRHDGLLLDVPCNELQVGPLLKGALCATLASESWNRCAMNDCAPRDPCPDNYYGNGFECQACPNNATSKNGSNSGLLACTCGEGLALAHNWWVGGENKLECVNASGCDGGVVDAATGKCWKLFDNQPRGKWSWKEFYCQRWGGTLADVSGAQGFAMLKLLLDSYGYNATEVHHVWVRAHAELLEPASPTLKSDSTTCPLVQWDSAGLHLRSDMRCNSTLEVQHFVCESHSATPIMADAQEAIVVHSECAGCQLVRVGDNKTLSRVGICSLACSNLHLKNLGIENINALTFKAMAGVRFLDLSYNKLSALERSIYAGLTTLTSLDLSNNRIELVHSGALAGLGTLASISLASNSITHIPPGLFDEMRTLHVLFLSNNLLGCQPTFRFAVDIMDGTWASLPPCLPQGCNTDQPAFGLDGVSERTALHIDVVATIMVMALVRWDVVTALDQANMDSKLYVTGDDGKRYWCVATLESFDPATAFRPRPTAARTSHWLAEQMQTNDQDSTQRAYLQVTGPQNAEPGRPSSRVPTTQKKRGPATWAGVVLGITLVLVVLASILGLALAWKRRKRGPARGRRHARMVGLTVDRDAGLATKAVARVEQVWGNWIGIDGGRQQRVYSEASTPGTPGSRSVDAFLWEMDPSGAPGRERVYSVPSSPMSRRPGSEATGERKSSLII